MGPVTDWHRESATFEMPSGMQCVLLGWRGVWECLKVALGCRPVSRITFSVWLKGEARLVGAQMEMRR